MLACFPILPIGSYRGWYLFSFRSRYPGVFHILICHHAGGRGWIFLLQIHCSTVAVWQPPFARPWCRPQSIICLSGEGCQGLTLECNPNAHRTRSRPALREWFQSIQKKGALVRSQPMRIPVVLRE